MTIDYASKCRIFIEKNNIIAQHRVFDERVHTAQAAADLLGVGVDEIVKNRPDDGMAVLEARKRARFLCVKTVVLKVGGKFIACILKGGDKVDLGKVRTLRGTGDVRVAKPDEVLEATGYPVGGVPPFGHGLEVYIDEAVIALSTVHAGGGSDHALVTLRTKELVRTTGAIIVRLVMRNA
ncbi:MAG: YbaK/EbsC family protein [Nanoarchaeota archaeon]